MSEGLRDLISFLDLYGEGPGSTAGTDLVSSRQGRLARTRVVRARGVRVLGEGRGPDKKSCERGLWVPEDRGLLQAQTSGIRSLLRLWTSLSCWTGRSGRGHPGLDPGV